MNKEKIFTLILSSFLLIGCTSNIDVEEENLTLSMIDGGLKLDLFVEDGLKLESSSFEAVKSDLKEQGVENLHPEQITGYFSLGDLSFAFVSQPNSWTPLLEVREWEKEGNTAWSGVLVKQIKGPWEILFVIPEEDFNPLALRLRDQDLLLDVVDDSGAGSGEGQLLRYTYPFKGVSEENLYKWVKEACDGYYVPETYTEESCA